MKINFINNYGKENEIAVAKILIDYLSESNLFSNYIIEENKEI